MILFLILFIVIALLLIRGQMKRQHREMLSALNPEKLRELDEIEREKNRRGLIAFGCIMVVLLLAYACSLLTPHPPAKAPAVTYHEYPAKP
jgi:ABC-type Fe3+ transport system permease subunit